MQRKNTKNKTPFALLIKNIKHSRIHMARATQDVAEENSGMLAAEDWNRQKAVSVPAWRDQIERKQILETDRQM